MDLSNVSIEQISAAIAAAGALVTAASAAVTKVIRELRSMRSDLNGADGEPTLRKLVEEIHGTTNDNAQRIAVVESDVAETKARVARVELVQSVPPLVNAKH